MTKKKTMAPGQRQSMGLPSGIPTPMDPAGNPITAPQSYGDMIHGGNFGY
jgi:hypothetical protein